MSLQKIEVTKEFLSSVESLFSYLSEHENLAILFAPAKVTRVRDGHDSRNGVGSVRQVKIPLAPVIEETVTAFKPGELVEYRISNHTPLKNHRGVMLFSPTATGSRLHYTITFESRIPFSGPLVKAVLETVIRNGLKDIR